MKFAAAYYLLLIYATVIAKPIIPVAEDMLLHYFAETHHITTVHAAEGKDHVDKEMAASGKDDVASKNQKADKAEESIHEIAIDITFNCLNPHASINRTVFTKKLLSTIYIDFISPPPRIII